MRLSAEVHRVQAHLTSFGLSLQVREMPQTTRTAREAAAALGCPVSQIAKSLVFLGEKTGEPILVVASGANRVDERRIAALVGQPVALADAAFAQRSTGFPVGGVPPVGHRAPLRTIIDQDLSRHDELWAAAGTPYAVFRLTAADLLRITAGEVATVT